MRSKIRIAAALMTSMLLTSPAIAADVLPVPAPQPAPSEPDRWQFSFAPYFWIAGLDGKSQVFGLGTVDVSQDFSDILPDLDFGVMAAGEARYGRFSVFTDMSYVKVTTESATPRGIIADNITVRSTTFTALLAGAYTIYEDEKAHLDILAGARYWDVETRISLSGGLIGNVSDEDSAKWVDGLVGFKGNYSFTDKIFVTGWGMVGGGGADIDWDVLGGLGYKFNDTFSAIAGYRAQGVNYSDDGFTYDMIQHGPIIGMNIKF
jgi:hypothetical protein